jgi:SAM-dependent methyltransferase
MLRRLRRVLLPHWTDSWPEVAARAKKVPTLHLGAGHAPLAGAVTVDANPDTKPTVVWNLNRFPWPFDGNSFDEVIALNILEHLDDFLAAMGEIHRICRPDARVTILVPHFSSGALFVDPTHRQFLSARSCDYFISGTQLEKEYGFYVNFRFQLERRFVGLTGGLRYLPGAGWLARRCTEFWENYLCYALRGGAIFWQLRSIK